MPWRRDAASPWLQALIVVSALALLNSLLRGDVAGVVLWAVNLALELVCNRWSPRPGVGPAGR